VPIGLEDRHQGVVCLLSMQAKTFSGEGGNTITLGECPADMKAFATEKRRELIERLAEVDEGIADLFLAETEPSPEQLAAAVRRATIALKFVPLFMGSAYKNKGVQALLDGVAAYLPSPRDVPCFALDLSNKEAKVALTPDDHKPLVALAFKLEESKFGQLTYLRIYQGQLVKGEVSAAGAGGGGGGGDCIER
jgi:elongation factor G